jgi:hypothetical protein
MVLLMMLFGSTLLLEYERAQVFCCVLAIALFGGLLMYAQLLSNCYCVSFVNSKTHVLTHY